MKIELLYWSGCPSHPEAAELLGNVMEELRIDASVERREVKTLVEAETERFPGSPTIRVDGRDVDPEGANERPSLSCRLYRRQDGRPTPIPTREQLKEALT